MSNIVCVDYQIAPKLDKIQNVKISPRSGDMVNKVQQSKTSLLNESQIN